MPVGLNVEHVFFPSLSHPDKSVSTYNVERGDALCLGTPVGCVQSVLVIRLDSLIKFIHIWLMITMMGS